jgi:hypothetical protein
MTAYDKEKADADDQEEKWNADASKTIQDDTKDESRRAATESSIQVSPTHSPGSPTRDSTQK